MNKGTIVHRSGFRIGFFVMSLVLLAMSSLLYILSQPPITKAVEVVASDIAQGLWKTGVDAAGNKVTGSFSTLAQNTAAQPLYSNPAIRDLHWEIARVTRTDGSAAGTCQYSFNGSGLQYMDQPTPAYIVTGGTVSGYAEGVGYLVYTGESNNQSIMGSDGQSQSLSPDRYPWKRVSSSANWIGQNVLGHNYSNSTCKDPGKSGYVNSNIYEFRTKSTAQFTIDDDVDLTSVKLTLSGGVDNAIKAFVNGCQLLNPTGVASYAYGTSLGSQKDWQNPGFSASGVTYSFVSDPSCVGFKKRKDGGNTLTLKVKSTWGLTGLLIDKIEMSGSRVNAYTLNPNVSVTPQAVINGGKASFTYTVNNDGATSNETDLAYRSIIIPPGASLPPDFFSPRAPATGCSWYTSNITNKPIICTEVGFPARVFNAGLNTINSSSFDPQPVTISGSPGTLICRVLSVNTKHSSHYSLRGVNNDDNADSAPACVRIAKKPTVQVWGGDLVVRNTNGNIQGESWTVPDTSTTEWSDSIATGLWRTGVDSSNNKVTFTYVANSGKDTTVPSTVKDDPHWSIVSVRRPNGDTDPNRTCQRSYDGASLLNMNTSTPARIVFESSGMSPTRAGLYVNTRPDITGNYFGTFLDDRANSTDSSAHYPYGRTSTGANWIGQNSFGQDFSSDICRDPASGIAEVSNGNIYTFQLNNSFSINQTTDLSTIKLTAEGGVDNQIKAYINDVQLVSSTGSSDWQQPDFNLSGGFTFKVDPSKPSPFNYTNNKLTFEVQSAGSHTALLLDKLTLGGFVTKATLYGSWAEYGVLASGQIGFYSAGSLANYSGRKNAAAAKESTTDNLSDYLTFANTPSEGGFAMSTVGPDVAASVFRRYSSLPVEPINVLNSSTVATGKHYISVANDVTIGATGGITLPSSTSVVVYAPGKTVTIGSDITYSDGPYSSSSNIPQLVIIAGSIIIKDNVTHVDSWLLATDTISTCNTQTTPYYSGLSTDVCNKPLRINGPIQTAHLQLRRTAGADGSTEASLSSPAEVLNLRSDAYLWAISQGIDGTIRTTYTRDIAPRF